MSTTKDKEIERLRTVMVFAMLDCQEAMRARTLRGVALAKVRAAHDALKSALAKK